MVVNLFSVLLLGVKNEKFKIRPEKKYARRKKTKFI